MKVSEAKHFQSYYLHKNMMLNSLKKKPLQFPWFFIIFITCPRIYIIVWGCSIFGSTFTLLNSDSEIDTKGYYDHTVGFSVFASLIFSWSGWNLGK